ncbi:MAG: NUDIX domain-containing protein [Bacilli bacterium]|nr:NUDIX domain-containing protein [Bacilli bacterium]
MVTIINFSSRKNGNSLHIANVCKDNFEQSIVYNLSENDYHKCGNCNYECLQKEKCPVNDNLYKLYESIFDSELVIFIVPNYSEFPCANYFIFNERLRGYFSTDECLYKKYTKINKKFIVVTNTQNNNFEVAFKYHVDKHKVPDILYMSSKKFKQSSISGSLMENDDAKNVVIDFIKDEYVCERSAMAIVFYQDKLLVTNEEIYGRLTISLPKGHIENDETTVETAMRECFEETGVKLKRRHFITELEPFEIRFINHYNKLVKKAIYPIVFELHNFVRPYSIEKRIKEIKYMPIFEFMDKGTYDNIKEIVKIAMTKRG